MRPFYASRAHATSVAQGRSRLIRAQHSLSLPELLRRAAGVPVSVCNSAAVPGYQSTHLSHLERIPLDHGVWQPIRRPLAITAFALKRVQR
jgi:hypothetical protein